MDRGDQSCSDKDFYRNHKLNILGMGFWKASLITHGPLMAGDLAGMNRSPAFFLMEAILEGSNIEAIIDFKHIFPLREVNFGVHIGVHGTQNSVYIGG